MGKPAMVAMVCEHVAHIIWLGLMAPTKSCVGVHGNSSGLSTSSAEVSSSLTCRVLCRDATSMLALLDVVEALHQSPRLGVMPLAPSLLNTFLTLLQAVARAYQQRVTKHLT